VKSGSHEVVKKVRTRVNHMKRREFLGSMAAAAGGPLVAARRASAEEAWRALRDGQAPAGAGDDRFWRLVRAQFHLAPDVAYLNTGGLGASPFAVTNTVKAAMDREEQAPNPGHSEEDWARIRAKCARMLGPGCSADEIALVSTATEGINVILNGLPLGRGDEVITSTHEHVALNIPLLHKMKTAGLEVRTFEPDLARATGNVERIERLISPRTRLIFVSHVTTTTGQLLPVAGIGRLAASRKVLFALDGAQSLCQFPIDIKATGADFYTASGHKWLLGPKRTGVLYVRADRVEALTPSIVGAYSDAGNSLSERRLALRAGAPRFEFGTQNDALVYGLEAAADFVAAIGLPLVERHNRALAERAVAGLAGVPNVGLLSPAEDAFRTAMITFQVKGRDNRQVAGELMRRRVRARSVTEGGLDAVRASFHVCNHEGEVDRLLAELRDIAGTKS
jgi:selenocysteine lyase/cysteine desulfurase